MLLTDKYLEARKQLHKVEAELYEITGGTVSPMECALLRCGSGYTMGQLAKKLNVSLPQITDLTKKLQAKGYVTIVTDKRDRRVNTPVHTTKALALLTILTHEV